MRTDSPDNKDNINVTDKEGSPSYPWLKVKTIIET